MSAENNAVHHSEQLDALRRDFDAVYPEILKTFNELMPRDGVNVTSHGGIGLLLALKHACWNSYVAGAKIGQ